MDDAHRRGQAANHVRERSWSIGRTLITVLVAAGSVALLLWVAPPKAVLDQIGDMKLAWVIAALGFELASCLSYVVVFRLFFPEPPRAVSDRDAAQLRDPVFRDDVIDDVLVRRDGSACRQLRHDPRDRVISGRRMQHDERRAVL